MPKKLESRNLSRITEVGSNCNLCNREVGWKLTLTKGENTIENIGTDIRVKLMREMKRTTGKCQPEQCDSDDIPISGLHYSEQHISIILSYLICCNKQNTETRQRHTLLWISFSVSCVLSQNTSHLTWYSKAHSNNDKYGK